MILAEGNRSYRSKTFPNATLFTTNSTLTDPRMNPVLGGGRPATNHLNHDMALKLNFMSLLLINSIPTSQKTLVFHCKDQSVKAHCNNTVVIVL